MALGKGESTGAGERWQHDRSGTSTVTGVVGAVRPAIPIGQGQCVPPTQIVVSVGTLSATATSAVSSPWKIRRDDMTKTMLWRTAAPSPPGEAGSGTMGRQVDPEPRSQPNMTNPTSHVALVTGGSRGIGRAVVEALLRRGDRVWFTGLDAARLAAAERELGERYPPPLAVGRVCDIRHFPAIENLVAEIDERDGRLDVLVNNAGLGYFAPVDEMDPEMFETVIETNLTGAFHGIRAAAPLMRRDGKGWIFNIASLAAKNPFAGGAAYNASKFGLLGLSDAAMLDLRHAGIRVAAICPGSVETDFGSGRMRDGGDWRLQPEDVAKVVTDLLDFPDRALPSRIEIRPTRPPKN